ncbi:Hypothetical predicted protein [Paramuricea clavata]|uniref:Uncharacterized protein n=1 Tax=Paramuricea clavata TaxID=317549 RepID=A0A7D9J2T0_PARCT|nr:Hypothetical predicted protein [Paramuricea clavata]
METLHRLLTAESVRNKHRMAVEPLVELTSKKLLDYLMSMKDAFITMSLLPYRYRISESNKRGLYEHPFAICVAGTGKLVFLNWNSKTKSSNLVQLRLHSPADSTVLQRNLETNGLSLCYMNVVALFCGQKEILFVDIEGTTKVTPTQFKTKASAIAFFQQHIDSDCNAGSTLKVLQAKIQNYLEKKRTVHKKLGSIGIVILNEERRFTCLCQGNGDMIVTASNHERAFYLIATTFDGVGILGTATLMTTYLTGWLDVTGMALSGDNLAICADGKIYVHVPSQKATRLIVVGPNMLPISNKATSVAWVAGGLLYCEDHCLKLYYSGEVTVVSGAAGKGDKDGLSSQSKLCQPVGICVEFDRNIYVADSGSGSVKLVNRPLKGIVDFLSNLRALLVAFNVHSKKASTSVSPTIGEAINMVKETLEYVQSCSMKSKELQSLKENSTTDGPEGTVSNKCLKSLELLKRSIESLDANVKDLSTKPGFELKLNLESLLTLHVENQHAVTHFKRDTFTMYEYALIFGCSIEEAVKRVSKWAAHYYTHPKSYYKLPTSGAVSLPRIRIPKPLPQILSRNEEAQMRLWAKRHGKCVRQRNVRQDNTKDRAGTLPINLYECETTLNPLNLKELKDLSTEHSKSSESSEDSDSEVSCSGWDPQLSGDHQLQQRDQEDSFSIDDDDDDDGGNDSEDGDAIVDASLESLETLIRPSRFGRSRRFTGRMAAFLQSGM